MCKADFCKSDHLKAVRADHHLMNFLEKSEDLFVMAVLDVLYM